MTGRSGGGLPSREDPGRLVAVLRAAGGSAAICGHCRTALTAISGVGLTVFVGPAGRFVLGTDGRLIDRIEDLQISLDQGPCVEAVRSGEPVLIEDLAAAAARVRWPAFTAQARHHGVAAVFAFPVFVGRAPMAVLDLCRSSPGPLSGLDRDRAAAYAAAASVLLVDDAEVGADGAEHAGAAVSVEAARVQQATGMVMGQIDADATAALHRLRGHAFSQDRPLDGVVDDILAGRLCFSPAQSP